MYVEFKKDRRGKYRWRLRSANHQIVSDSAQGYSRLRDCRKAYRKIRDAFEGGAIEEREG